MSYIPASDRYDRIPYRRVGRSGLKLPALSLGLWHNFGGVDTYQTSRAMLRRAFDLGMVHFDLANNYGPPPGSAEETLGRVLAQDLRPYRDELIISSKAGWGMWAGPYGDWGSRKYLVASLDQSLRRLGLDYVDIFYHHRPDPETPLEETMGALDFIVRSGRALYAGISSYGPKETANAAALLKDFGTPCLIHQPSYNLFRRDMELGLSSELKRQGMGAIVFSPLAQGLLTNRYDNGIPADSRVSKSHGFLDKAALDHRQKQIRELSQLAQERGQSLAQMAISWVLRNEIVCSALIGASRESQIEDCAGAMKNLDFSTEELRMIDTIAPVEATA
jgi:L-glyceraldehyde 3-phosphate reductase